MATTYREETGDFARIKIDYRGKKPSAKFSFPGKRTGRQSELWSYSLMWTLIVWAIVFILIGAGIIGAYFWEDVNKTVDEQKRDRCISNIDNTKDKVCYLQQIGKDNLAYSYLEGGFVLEEPFWKEFTKLRTLYYIVTFLFTLLIIRIFFAKRIVRNLAKSTVKLDKIISGHYYNRIFKNVPKEKYVEIPLFRNIFLDYEAKGEFSKYLTHFEIREHPFRYNRIRTNWLGKEKGIDKEVNKELWYARFYFKKIPKSGHLEVKWK